MADKLYVFDFDYTLIDMDSSTGWCRFLADEGVVRDPSFLQKEAQLMEQYDQGSMDVHDYIRFSMGALRNCTAAEVDALSRRYAQERLPQHIFAEGLELVQHLRERGERMVIVSASAAFIVRSAAALLGFAADEVIAVEIERAGAYYADTIAGRPPFQEGKVECLKAWQNAHGLAGAQVLFWTDSINDLPLCLYAARAHAVNPSPVFAAEAERRGFEILHWRHSAAAAALQDPHPSVAAGSACLALS